MRKLLETKNCIKNFIIGINIRTVPLEHTGDEETNRYEDKKADDAQNLTSQWRHRQIVYVKKKQELDSSGLKQRGCINWRIQGLHPKEQRKTNFSDQKQHDNN